MKLTLELGRDEELRKEILRLVRAEVRAITGEEIREIIKQHMNEQNIPARVVAAFKDLVSAQIDRFKSGYGRMAAEDLIKAKFQEMVDTRFETFFKTHCIPFLTNYVMKNLGGTIDLLKGLTSGGKNETKP